MGIETVEGDYVIRGNGREILRIHFSDESMTITAGANPNVLHTIVCTIEEGEELSKWIHRRIHEDFL